MGRKGIPTVMNITEYRSRLEAKWACMFDSLGWKYTYEPFDLDGYIPDFCFSGWQCPTIVEIKPAVDVYQLHDAMPKIVRSGWRDESLLLGATPTQYNFGLITQEAGWETIDNDAYKGTLDVCRLERCLVCKSFFPCHNNMGWQCVVCGAYDGDGHLNGPLEYEVENMWREAGNQVKWYKK